MLKIAIGNQKGGCGKSATCHALGVGLHQLGRRVLMVDTDPQSSLTSACGVKDASDANLASVMSDGAAVGDVLFELEPGLDLAPADIALSRTELGLVPRMGREFVLKRALSAVASSYDVCLIDCPPSLGVLTVNALAAADYVLVPSQPQIADLRGLHLFLTTIVEIKDNEINPELEILGILPTFFDGRLVHHQDAIEAMKKAGWPILPLRIGRSVRVAEAAGAGESIITYEPQNPRADEYLELTRYVNQWLDEKRR